MPTLPTTQLPRPDGGKLADRLTAARTSMREQRRILARARRLYVRLCRTAIHEDLSGDTLDYCAGRMLDSGMYAESQSRPNSLQGVRFSILRQMWRLDSVPGPRYGRVPTWHEWTFRNGWVAHTWRRMLWQRETA